MVPTMLVAEGVTVETGMIEIVQAVEILGCDVADGELALRTQVTRCVELAVSGKACMRAIQAVAGEQPSIAMRGERATHKSMRCEGATSGIVTRKTVAETVGRKSVEAAGVGGKGVEAAAASMKAAAANVKTAAASVKTAAANVEAAAATVKSTTATAAVKSATATAAVKSATATTAVPATSAVAGGCAARNARRGYGNAG